MKTNEIKNEIENGNTTRVRKAVRNGNDMNIILKDTFNDRVISRHSTVTTAIRAQHRHLAAVRKHNGPGCYLTYSIEAADGSDISRQLDAARVELGY